MTARFERGFETLENEVADRTLGVTGSIPDWLDGSLVRNGPAKFEVGGERVAHWFDGLGMLHRFAFEAGTVSYTNRFLRGETYRRAVESGELSGQFATGGGSWLRRIYGMLFGDTTDNANIHVARMGGRCLAMTEVPQYVAFDPASLGTEGRFAFDDDLGGQLNCAHVIPDPHRGETVGLLTDFGRPSVYRFYRVPDGSTSREEIATIEADRPTYVHSFALTERFVVLTEHPFDANPLSFFTPGGEGFVDFFDWRPEQGTTVHVMDRETGDVVARRRTDPFFVFHHVNAFERDGTVVVDLVTYPDADVVDGLFLGGWDDWLDEDGTNGTLRRYRIPLDGGRIESETLYEGCEMPRIAPRDRTRFYRSAYVQGSAERDGNHVAKVEVETGATRTWSEAGLFLEEPIVVPAPGSDAPSDEGVVLVTALDADADAGRSILLVLDAGTLEERARAPLPHHVPFGFHGRYFPEL
ncbi:MAG: carotenoid cleavage dioxygenase-like enzyme [Halobacteriales archaeon]